MTEPGTEIVTTSPKLRRQRRLLGGLAVVAVLFGTGGFAYAIWTNSHKAEHAQETAQQAKDARTYGVQLICAMLNADLREVPAHPTRADVLVSQRLTHYYDELECAKALQQPLVPLSKLSPSPRPKASARAGPATLPPPPPGPGATPTPAPQPSRTPGPRPSPSHSPSPSPSHTPVVCVSSSVARACVGSVPFGDGGVQPPS